jgi:RNA polymerase sigma-70 factor (ECF subfamily)
MISKRKKRQSEKELYYKYADYMFTVCYRYIGNRESSEETLNNGFLKVFKNYQNIEYRGEQSFRNWIKKIMINECLMYLRAKNDFELLAIEEIDENNHITMPEYDLDNQIMSMIKNLPIGYRTVFNLYAIEGYTHNEISEKLKIKESTSRSQLTMARKLLKEQLVKNGYETVG